MPFRPPSSRSQLKWKVFDQEGGGAWKLVLPRYYADLFQATFPNLLRRTGGVFRDSSTGKTKIISFRQLDEQAEKKVRAFLIWYGRAVCISTNEHLEDEFTDELDFCLALDFARPSPTDDRTKIGDWEYQAKYQQDNEAVARLAAELGRAVSWLPTSKLPKPRLLSYVPSDPNKPFYLPAVLAKAVRDGTKQEYWGVKDPLVVPTLTAGKQSAKNLTIGQKIAQWNDIIEADGIDLSRSVKGSSVIVVDDLYQSGASLWSFAKYLKAQEAAVVVGLPCVKSLRDTDNK